MYKKILITGGAGFIGSNFIRYLLGKSKCQNSRQRRGSPKAANDKGNPKSKIQIINLDKLTYSGNIENLKDVEKDPRYNFAKGDICDKRLVSKLTKGCDAVINFAAESHVDRSIRNSEEFIRTNIFGTQVLLEAAKRRKVKRFLQISTDEVYGSVEKGYADEKSALLPNSPYSASKAAADLLVRSYFITHKVPAVITRSSNNFGPYQYPEKIIPLFITNLIEGKKVPVYAAGRNERDWLYVLDNCAAIKHVLERGRPGEIYNIGGGTQLKNINLTKKILKTLNKSSKFIKFVKDRPGHDMRYALSSFKTLKLGWKPEYNFKEALEKTVIWYKENRSWWERLKKKEEKFW